MIYHSCIQHMCNMNDGSKSQIALKLNEAVWLNVIRMMSLKHKILSVKKQMSINSVQFSNIVSEHESLLF